MLKHVEIRNSGIPIPNSFFDFLVFFSRVESTLLRFLAIMTVPAINTKLPNAGPEKPAPVVKKKRSHVYLYVAALLLLCVAGLVLFALIISSLQQPPHIKHLSIDVNLSTTDNYVSIYGIYIHPLYINSLTEYKLYL